MRRITLLGAAVVAAASVSTAFASEPVAAADVLGQITGIATFTSDGVNLREGPSASDPYLCYTGEPDTYVDADCYQWSNQLGRMRIGNQYITPDHEKIQGNQGWQLAALGAQGDWIKLYHAPYEVWTMKKFVSVEPLVPITASTTYTAPGYDALAVTGPGDGAMAVLYQEPGMDEDGGLLFGSVKGGAILFTEFLPVFMRYDERAKDVSIAKDGDTGYLLLTFGPAQKARGTDYEVIDIKGFDADNVKTLVRMAETLPAGQQRILVATADGAVLL